MLKRLLLALLLFGAFGYGLTQLFLLRFQDGRSLSTVLLTAHGSAWHKALYDALREMPHLELQRNFRAIAKLQPPAPVTPFTSAHHSMPGGRTMRCGHVEQLAVTGTRVVITFLPVDRGPTANEAKLAEDEEKARKKLREEITS
jgi:hypothetical protein